MTTATASAKTSPSGWVTEGDPAPEFELSDQHGRRLRLADYKGRWVVIFFYPKDGSFGCTAEACEFRDSFADFRAAGAEVLGISSDGVESHRNFALSLRLPYSILSDQDEKVRKAWGVPKTMGLIRSRVTFVVDPLGRIRHRFSSQFSFKEHSEKALALVREIRGQA